MKVGADGSLLWQKTYSGSESDQLLSIQATADGGFIAAGDTNSFGAGNDDLWLLKLTNDGGVSWQRTYGGSGVEILGGQGFQITPDGGYVLAGATGSSGAGDWDMWVLKVTADGAVPSFGQRSTAVVSTANLVVTNTAVTAYNGQIGATNRNVTVADVNLAVAQQAAAYPTPKRVLARDAALGSSPTGKSGCFIATAAYGSYLDPHVDVLRRFRDRWLLTNAPGRAFAQFYYNHSPRIAAYLNRHEAARVMVRVMLTPVVWLVEYPAFFLLLVPLCYPILTLSLTLKGRGRYGVVRP